MLRLALQGKARTCVPCSKTGNNITWNLLAYVECIKQVSDAAIQRCS